MAPKLAAMQRRGNDLREARAVAALDDPNIVHIYHVGDDDGTPYFVMEFLEGETLAERLPRTPRPTARKSPPSAVKSPRAWRPPTPRA